MGGVALKDRSQSDIVKIKHATCDAFTRKKISITTGDWADKTEFFLSKFEDIAQAASVQSEMAILDLQDPSSNAFVFLDMEIATRCQPSHATKRTY